MKRSNTVGWAFCASAALCGIASLALPLAGTTSGWLNTALTIVAYMIYVPGGLVATAILPEDEMQLLWPMGLLVCGLLYGLLF